MPSKRLQHQEGHDEPSSPSSPSSSSSSSHSMAGVIGGIAGTVVAHPFDLIKVRMQTGDGVLGARPTAVLLNTVREEGVSALYRGITFPILGYVPVNLVVFGAYGASLSWLAEIKGRPARTEDAFLAGSLAGIAQVPVVVPVEVFKIRMQSQLTGGNSELNRGGKTPVFRNPLHALASISKAEGIPGFYRGTWATILRDSIGYGIYFSTFHHLKNLFTLRDAESAGHLGTLAAGGFSGMICYAMCYPLDTIKSRVQSANNSSIASAYRDVFARGGVGGFYKGLGPTLMRAFPENAVILYTYDTVVRILDGLNIF